MPIVSIKMARGRTIDQKREVAKSITDVMVSTLDVPPEWVSVLFEEFDRENWSTGGKLHIDKFGHGHGKKVSK